MHKALELLFAVFGVAATALGAWEFAQKDQKRSVTGQLVVAAGIMNFAAAGFFWKRQNNVDVHAAPGKVQCRLCGSLVEERDARLKRIASPGVGVIEVSRQFICAKCLRASRRHWLLLFLLTPLVAGVVLVALWYLATRVPW